jgi:periplasmic protein TonB
MTKETPRLGGALGVSAAVHAGMLALILLLVSVSPGPVAVERPPAEFRAVYIATAPGPAGGGGASNAPAPPEPVAVPPHRAPDPVPVVTPPHTPPPEEPAPRLDAPIQTDFATVLQTPGTAIGAPPAAGGKNPGSGAGPGTRGSGLGPGLDSGLGDGPRRVGGDVAGPELVRQPQPQYTAQAMQAKVQGSVTLEAVVRAAGTVGDVKVIKSLDKVFGLDEQAILSARQWLFRPGRYRGQPVDVLVTLVLDFRIH